MGKEIERGAVRPSNEYREIYKRWGGSKGFPKEILFAKENRRKDC